MTYINVNSGGLMKYDNSGFTVSNKICYELDKEYFIERAKQYRLHNLEYVKSNQKKWYDRKPETIKKRKIKKLKMQCPKEKKKYDQYRKYYLRYREKILTRYQRSKYKKVMFELLNPKIFMPQTGSYLTLSKKETILYFD